MKTLSPMQGRIHRAACRLFRERGYQGTSVRDIAEAVGLQGGSLYAHFESKDEMLARILDDAAARFFAALRPIADGPLGVMQKLRAAIIAHVGVITADLDAAEIYTVEWRHLPSERRAAFLGRRDEYEHLFRGLVEEAIRQRHLNSTDAAQAARFILSSLNWVFTWFRHDGPMSSEEVARMLAGYIFDGLKRRTA